MILQGPNPVCPLTPTTTDRTLAQRELVPSLAPCLGVGHSMGSLLHLLIGSIMPTPTNGNVLISYNNK